MRPSVGLSVCLSVGKDTDVQPSYFRLSVPCAFVCLTRFPNIPQARLMHGEDVQGELSSPVVLQSIATNGFNFNFITLQLNTLDLSSPDGVKNIAWIDAGPQNNIREDWRPTTQMGSRDSQKPYVLREFNPVVFEKVLAMYLNGGVRWPR